MWLTEIRFSCLSTGPEARTSFITPKIILLSLAYLVASWVQRFANCSFVGPPWPIICPSQRASVYYEYLVTTGEIIGHE